VLVQALVAQATIEQAFSKLKTHLRKAAERTIHGLWNAVDRIIDLYSPKECSNSFAACGHDADWSKTAPIYAPTASSWSTTHTHEI
jgi:hypothetical protein